MRNGAKRDGRQAKVKIRKNRGRITTCSLLCALFLAILPNRCLASSVTVTASELNGRDRPGMDGEIEARFSDGEILETISLSGNWVEVEGGECGTVWCCADYLTEREPYTAANTSSGRVRIRQSPGGKPVGYVGKGKSVTVERCVLGWGYVGTGWVDLEFFTESR